MQGAVPPYIPGPWTGLSPYDLYQQAAQDLKPTSSKVSPALYTHGATSSMERPVDPYALWHSGAGHTTAMAAYMQKLQERNGHLPLRASDSVDISSLHATGRTSYSGSGSDRHNILSDSQTTSSSDIYSYEQFKASGHKQQGSNTYHTSTTSVNMFPYYDMSKASGTDSRTTDLSVSSHSGILPSISSVAQKPVKDISLKQKSAYLPSSIEQSYISGTGLHHALERHENRMTSSLYDKPTVPTSTKNAEVIPSHHSSSLISYYSESIEREIKSQPNGLPHDKASKEAARILQMSQHSDMGLKHNEYSAKVHSKYPAASKERQQSSPFQPIGNTFPLLHSSFGTNNRSQSLPVKSPVNLRAENLSQKQTDSRLSSYPNGGQLNENMWTKFNFTPPNMDLGRSVEQTGEKRPSSGSDYADGLMKPPKKQKNHHPLDYGHEAAVVREVQEKRKSPKANNRLGIFTDNPEIDAIVDANVQQIFAACKQIDETSQTLNQNRKSPKQKSSDSGNSSYTGAKSSYNQLGHISACHQPFDFSRGHEGQSVLRDQLPGHIPLAKPQNEADVMDMRIHQKGYTNINNGQQEKAHTAFTTEQSGQMRPIHSIESQITGPVHYPNNDHTIMKGQHSEEEFVKNIIDSHAAMDKYVSSHCPTVSNLSHQVNEMRQQKHTHHQNSYSHAVNSSFGHGMPDLAAFRKQKLLDTDTLKKMLADEIEDMRNGKYNKQPQTYYSSVKQESVKKESKFDPYSFTDEPRAPSRPAYKSSKFNNSAMSGASYESTPVDPRHFFQQKEMNKHHQARAEQFQYYKSKTDVKLKTQFQNIRDFGKLEKNQKMKMSIDKSQGMLQNKKSFSKHYGIKSSNALLKRSLKIYQAKPPTVRPKWRNNPKYKKKPKDDFAENLMKNLGYPPLTLKDLVTKRMPCIKIRKGGQTGQPSVAGNVQSAVKKVTDKEQVLQAVKPAQNGKILESGHLKKEEMINKYSYSSHAARPLRRSKSVDNTRTSKDCLQRSRSHSLDDLMVNHRSKEMAAGPVMVAMDNHIPRPYNSAEIDIVSSQIDKLRSQITGNSQNLENNTVIEVPKCGCLGPDAVYNEAVEGPYYTHLGAGRSVEAIRKILESRTGVTGYAIRIEKLRYTGKEGKSSQGCPIAKWIIRRSSSEEKYLSLVRHRTGHVCETAWIIVGLVAWEGVPGTQADELYDFLSTTLPQYGNETERRCGTNDRKTCACQGADLMKRGASFSFGCSWSMYFNGCKFARSVHVRKFKLKNDEKEQVLEDKLQNLATHVGPLYEKCAPDAHANQSYFSGKAQDCRLGKQASGPFSGVTACVDFCAHAHKDIHNMNNGSTVVVTLTKHRGLSKPDDEQLHVLPMYVLDPSDENGSYEGQYQKIQNGSLEVLHQYPLELRLRAQPLESCKKRKLAKKTGKRAAMNAGYTSWDSSSSVQSTPQKVSHDAGYKSNQPGSANITPVKKESQEPHLGHFDDKPLSYDDLKTFSSHPSFPAMQEKFWTFYSAYGIFPPASFLAHGLENPPRPTQSGGGSHHGSSIPISQQPMPDQGQTRQHNLQPNAHQAEGQGPTKTVPLHSNMAVSAHSNPVVVQNPFTDNVVATDVQNVYQNGKNSSAYNGGKYNAIDQNLTRYEIENGYNRHAKDVLTHENSHVANHSGSGAAAVNHSQPEFPADGCALDLSFSSTSSKHSVHSQNELANRSSDGMSAQNGGTNAGYKSPLDLLSQAVDLRTKDICRHDEGLASNYGTAQPQTSHQPNGSFSSSEKVNMSVASLFNHQQNYVHSTAEHVRKSVAQFNNTHPHMYQRTEAQEMHKDGPVYQEGSRYYGAEMNGLESLGPAERPQMATPPAPSLIDPDIVKCQMEYNEDAFTDPDIGGVAVALCHGAVLFEVAKRELHATTGLRNPNRYHPTRISLVFYQHKNLNNERHGMYAYERKLEEMKMKRIEQMQLERGYVDMEEIENSFKGGKKRKAGPDDNPEDAEMAELLRSANGEYRYMWQCNTGRADALTSNTVTTKWVNPLPLVTGPYQKWV